MPLPSAPKPHDDAFHAVTTVGAYVNNADTKIGLLAAALTLLAGGVVRQRPRVEALLDAGLHQRGVVALLALGGCAVLLLSAGGCLFRALRPRLGNGLSSRFAFPHLAEADLDQLVAADPAEIRKEAWIQAQALSKIVLAKYRCFSKALTCGLLAGMAFFLWLLLVPVP